MSDQPRQRLERVPGSRRVRLTAVEGTIPEPDAEITATAAEPPASGGPNDERMRREVPPHY
ncbi:hypothetical protein [Microbacterium istanbulense]|uniref:Uncharacterized protein n=1 Tax=Microbacterium istanbulense TaxID=3122049 RepID=A0ABU8LNM5_9MICO